MVYQQETKREDKTKVMISVTKSEPKMKKVYVTVCPAESIIGGGTVKIKQYEDKPKGINYRPPMAYHKD